MNFAISAFACLRFSLEATLRSFAKKGVILLFPYYSDL